MPCYCPVLALTVFFWKLSTWLFLFVFKALLAIVYFFSCRSCRRPSDWRQWRDRIYESNDSNGRRRLSGIHNDRDSSECILTILVYYADERKFKLKFNLNFYYSVFIIYQSVQPFEHISKCATKMTLRRFIIKICYPKKTFLALYLRRRCQF